MRARLGEATGQKAMLSHEKKCHQNFNVEWTAQKKNGRLKGALPSRTPAL
jgi:hypothetical protein